MRVWEQATWATGVTEGDVIDRAGLAVAQLALRLTQSGDPILVLAGKGHNGDDALAAAKRLGDRAVSTFKVADPAADLPQFGTCLAAGPTLIIDGLFGIGLKRPLSSEWLRFIETVNSSKVPILAVDVPSGLNADTGETYGTAIRADTTLTLGAPKAGLLTPNALDYVGRLEVAAQIGLIPCPHHEPLNWSLPEDFDALPPARSPNGHKGSFGHLLIIAGSCGYHGAAVLAAQAALRAKPGLVTLWTDEKAYNAAASQLRAPMVHPWNSRLKPPDTTTAIVAGPGLASAALPWGLRTRIRQLWESSPLPMLVDASALAWLPGGQTPPGAIRVITPHPGEAARLLASKSAAVQADRVNSLRSLSARLGRCWVVLKGHQTLIGQAEGDIFINPSGNPGLAQGGSGDVLAGYLGGWLAQPEMQKDPALALRYGVWSHGATADQLECNGRNWTVEDVVQSLGTHSAAFSNRPVSRSAAPVEPLLHP